MLVQDMYAAFVCVSLMSCCVLFIFLNVLEARLMFPHVLFALSEVVRVLTGL